MSLSLEARIFSAKVVSRFGELSARISHLTLVMQLSSVRLLEWRKSNASAAAQSGQ